MNDWSAWYKDDVFYENLFQYLGSDTTDDSSTCVVAYQELFAALPNYVDAMYEYAAYKTATSEKGSGDGTKASFYLNNFILYNEAQILYFGLYEECDLDYFMMAFGNATQSVSGGLNTLTNFAWRTYGGENSQNFTDLATAITGGDKAAMGQNVAIIVKDVLNVSIPDASITATGDAYQYN